MTSIQLPMFGALSGIVHVDGKGARLGKYLSLPAGDTISEPVFVARGDDAAEGDGWLLAAVWRAAENRSDLAVFNATDVEAGPVALVQLGHRVPDGFLTAIGSARRDSCVRRRGKPLPRHFGTRRFARARNDNAISELIPLNHCNYLR